MKSVLIRVFESDGSVAMETNFHKFPVEIGRSTQTDFCIHDQSCSKFHCRVELRKGVLWFSDRKSTNGSFTDQDERISELQIDEYLRFRIGTTWIEIRIQEDLEDPIINDGPSLIDLPQAAPPVDNEPHVYREEPVILASYTQTPLDTLQEPSIPANAALQQPRTRDWVDGAIESLSGAKFLLLACGLILLPLLIELPSQNFSQEIPEKGLIVLVLTLGLAALSTITTYILARIFRRHHTFSNILFPYFAYFALMQSLYFLFNYSKTLWADSNYSATLILLIAMTSSVAFVIFNLRWIGNVGKRGLAIAGLLCMGSALFALKETPLQSQTRWKTITSRAEMGLVPMRVPASLFVSSDQFLNDIEKSAQTLKESR